MSTASENRPANQTGLISDQSWTGPQPADQELHGLGKRHGELWLFRHGSVQADWKGRVYGALDVPLSRKGRMESRERARAFRALNFEHVLSSDLSRAAVLAKLLKAATHSSWTTHRELREVQRGPWAGKTYAEVLSDHTDEVQALREDPWGYSGYGGECDQQIWERVSGLLCRHLTSTPNNMGEDSDSSGQIDRRPLAVVAHYNVLRVTLSQLVGIASKQSFQVRIDPSRAVLLRYSKAGWSLGRCNVGAPR